MIPSAVFIARPVATILLTLGVALSGVFAFGLLPVAPLPQVDFPTISVQAPLPGASPETVATSVAGPLERHLGQIADLTEMTSQSSLGNVRITLQFGLDRNIDGAARDVEAAINAARADLPSNLKSNPTYHKINPADAPILIIALTSKTKTLGQLYDTAATVLQQKLSQIQGIGEVDVGGSSLPAVRVELIPGAMFKYGIGLEDVRAGLAAANANSPKGAVEDGSRRFQVYTNDQATRASDYAPLVVAYRNKAAVRLTDIASIRDSVENLRNQGLANGEPSVLVQLFRQPGANIIAAVDRVKAALPQLETSIPGDVTLTLAADRTTTIRSSLADTERTFMISVLLVIGVVFIFLRNPRATLIPIVAVPISIIGTFGAMYLLGYSLDNLSLMALIVATGFVVDDAIVVLENVSRHLEEGMPRMEAALRGSREVTFTVLSMSLSLIAVFLPILLMGGIVGRLFREFAVTLSVAIVISLLVSLSTTPMMCSRLLDLAPRSQPGWFLHRIGVVFDWVLLRYDRSLGSALRHPRITLLVLLMTIGLNGYLYITIPKGFFPQQDTGRLMGSIQGDQSISFQLMRQKLSQFLAIVGADPAVDSVVGFTGGQQTNSGFVFVTLKPTGKRHLSADAVIARLRHKLNGVAGARLFLQSVQDIRVGGRPGAAQYQYTLQGESTAELYHWCPILTDALQHDSTLADVSSDLQQTGLETDLTIDRATAARLGVTPGTIDNTLYDAFGQRQVSTIYNPLNQYHVVMEVAPQYWQNPQALSSLYVSTSGQQASGTRSSGFAAGTIGLAANASGSAAQIAAVATDSARNQALNGIALSGKSAASSGTAVSTKVETMIPLAAFSRFAPGNAPLGVNHQGQFVAATISFNLAPGKSLSDATLAIARASNLIGLPATIHGGFAGTAQAFAQSLSTEPLLILAAILAVYIVLGILYESYIHPVTILSTLPSAGVGALIALSICGMEFTIIAMIGIILLVGIVKKNAIMMIDFAIDAQRRRGLSSHDAIREACRLRFRPIMMTTAAALFGALPMAFGSGDGAELRQPLGVSIVGGLIVSQVLTLYTTPVVYLYLDRFGLWARRQWQRLYPPTIAETPI